MDDSPPSNPYPCNAYIAQAVMRKDSVSDVEKSDEASDAPLRRDAHGLPLVPRPSDFTDDPLVSDCLSLHKPSGVLIACRIGPDG